MTDDKRILDVGCGYGRLSHLWPQENYIGIDVCQAALDRANAEKRGYTFFNLIDVPEGLPGMIQAWEPEIVLYYTVLLHHPDESLPRIVDETRYASSILICEVMNPAYQQTSVMPHAYNRLAEDYEIAFGRSVQDKRVVAYEAGAKTKNGNGHIDSIDMTLLHLA